MGVESTGNRGAAASLTPLTWYCSYYKEIPAIRTILCNDLKAEALASIERNVKHNNLDPTSHVVPNQGDAK